MNVIKDSIKVGFKMHKLTALCEPIHYKKTWFALFRCECGNLTFINIYKMYRKKKATKSCGCYARTELKSNLKHGGCGTVLWNRWAGLFKRCYDKGDKNYKNYGGRGIFIEDGNWRTDFATFRDWAEKNGFSPELQLDRIDNNKGYSPENCRWVTAKVNGNNTRHNVKIEAFGELKTMSEWFDDTRCKVKARNTLFNRFRNMSKTGYSAEYVIVTEYLPDTKFKAKSC